MHVGGRRTASQPVSLTGRPVKVMGSEITDESPMLTPEYFLTDNTFCLVPIYFKIYTYAVRISFISTCCLYSICAFFTLYV